jgi:hypothetical protein
MIPRSLDCAARRPTKEVAAVFDFLIGLAFVAMVIGPAILASIQRAGSHDIDA